MLSCPRLVSRFALVALVSLAVGMLVACFGDPSTDREWMIAERLIPQDPQMLLTPERLFDVEPVFVWEFSSEADLEGWDLKHLKASWDGGRSRFESTGGNPQMTRFFDPGLGEVHTIEVTLSGLTGMTKLYWAGAGEEFTKERRLTRKIGPRKRGKRVTFTFDLAAHASWREELERIRLEPTTKEKDTIRLVSVRGLRREVNPERFAAAQNHGFKFAFEADIRNVLLAVPGFSVERVVPPQGERLRLAYAVEESVAEPVTFRVVAEGGEGEPRTLFEETLDPPRHGGRWHEAEVVLTGEDQHVVTGEQNLRLETSTATPLNLARGLPFWANPEILQPKGTTEPPPNVILISIDTLRADHLSAYGHPHNTSPHLDAWAAESAVLFQNVVAQAPWTVPSHVSMFSGLDALRHGVNHADTVPADLAMLPEMLRQVGYSTAAITGGGYFRPQFGFAQGFDTYRYWHLVGSDEQLAENTEELLGWLDEHRTRPFFVFFHTYEVHYPYRKRQPFFDRLEGDVANVEPRGEIVWKRGRWESGARWISDYFAIKKKDKPDIPHLTEDEKQLVERMYDSGIAYVDDQLNKVFQHLDKLGLRGKTLIILTSDHGEALGEDDRAGHDYLDDFNVLIPLIVEFPDGRGAGEVVEEQVRSIDIVPTVLDYLGLDPPHRPDGVSLLPVIAGDPSGLPGEAWTYAASSNNGLGLRYQNRLKYSFNNSAWSEIAGEEDLLFLRRGEAERRDHEENKAQKKQLRELTKSTIEEQHQGVRMKITNHGAGRLEGFLEGPWGVVDRVKLADPSCRCVHWQKNRKARFVLRPGREITLLFENLTGGPLGLRGALRKPGGEAIPFAEEVALRDVPAGEESWVLSYSSSGWQSTRGTDEVDVGFKLWQVGERQMEEELPMTDPETEEQLRALGYIN